MKLGTRNLRVERATFEDLRSDRLKYLTSIGIVGSLTLTVASRMRDLEFYGVTKGGTAIGPINEFMYNAAWFIQLFAVIDALIISVFCGHFNTMPDTLLPLWLYLVGVFTYLVHLFLFDSAYWFNWFDAKQIDFNLTVDNVEMYVSNEVPTVGFFLVLLVDIPYRYLQNRTEVDLAALQASQRRASAQRAPRALRE